jgi:hypothetical protein
MPSGRALHYDSPYLRYSTDLHYENAQSEWKALCISIFTVLCPYATSHTLLPFAYR